MPRHKYLIIGGGMTAAAAVNGIRQADPSGTIGIISNEKHRPYSRPPLSKALWKGEPLDSIWRKMPVENVELFSSLTAAAIDAGTKVVTDSRGERFAFEKLLLATGGSVRRIEGAPNGVIYFRKIGRA